MSNVELVIKIPKDIYDFLQKNDTGTLVDKAIANGVLLQEGHGRLTDLDKIINFAYNTYGINSGKSITKDNEDIINYIYNKAEILIEADNTESEMNE